MAKSNIFYFRDFHLGPHKGTSLQIPACMWQTGKKGKKM